MPTPKKRIRSARYFFLGTLLGLFIVGLFFAAAHFLFPKPTTQLPIDQLIAIYNPPESPNFPQKRGFQIPKDNPTPKEAIKIPIIMYHYIEVNHDLRDTIRTSLAVTPYWFEKHLQYLRENNYETITLDDVAAIINGVKISPQKPVVLTFDDGYRDFYTDAWPILKKYNDKATLFVVPGFLDRPNYLYSWQLAQMATDSSRLLTIGAHTLHHVALPSVKPDLAWEEIAESKSGLEQKFGVKVDHIAYPYGFFNKDIEALVAKAGYKTSSSTIYGATQGKSNLFSLHRIRVGNYAGEILGRRLEGK